MFQLLQGETLLNTLTADFDNDGYDDQIVAVKRPNTPSIVVLTGLFNPLLSLYERSGEIVTTVTQVKTFTFYCMDITGEHKNALVYTGFTDSNQSVLQAFSGTIQNRLISFTKIADIKSDGTIFIQQVDRSSAYSLSLTTGSSFPIWVYTADDRSGAEALDQVQIMYDWDRFLEIYVKKSETYVPGKKIAAEALASIQDGTVETFSAFLEGLWYKTANTEEGIRYLFFNKNDEEIIFLLNDTEEVYSWASSTIRRNGVFISADNKSISNLSRRFDISLTGVDEIKIKVNDDVGMTIGTDTLWDGTYRKMSAAATMTTGKDTKSSDSTVAILASVPIWEDSDGTRVSFSENSYTAENASGQYQGGMSVLVAGDETILEFRSFSDTAFFSGSYKPVIQRDEANQENISVRLIPVSITIAGFTQTGAEPIVLSSQGYTG
jgi:hypothetical protein